MERRHTKAILTLVLLLCLCLFTGCKGNTVETAIATQASSTTATPSESVSQMIPGEEMLYDGTLQTLANGDSFYTPGKNHVTVDSESAVLYYNNLLVVFTYEDLSEEEQQNIAQSIEGEALGSVSGGIHAFQIKINDSSLNELNIFAETLRKQDAVMYACCEYPVQLMGNDPWNPDDPEDKGHENAPDGLDWWAEAIGAYTAWEKASIKEPAPIGIIDSGFLSEHEDLDGQITSLSNAHSNTPANHGTMVAGIIGAKSNNVGIRGIADTSQLYCADLWPEDSPDSYHTMAEYLAFVNYMGQCGVRVVNNSWGCLIPSEEDWLGRWGSCCGTYERYLEQRLSKDLIPTAEYCIVMISQLISSDYEDMILVHAAGNSSADARYNGFFSSITEDVFYGMDTVLLTNLQAKGITYQSIDDRILVVGAVENIQDVNGNYNIAYISNYGETVDIYAPGHIVYSTMSFERDSYGAEGGTSLAAPMVTGSVALLWSVKPELTVSELRHILLDSAQAQASFIDGSSDFCCPMVNIGAAVLSVISGEA